MVPGELDLKVKRITRLNGTGATKAFFDVAVDDAFLIKGVKVVDGKNGMFVSMPREQGKNGQWYETVVPMKKEVRAQISEVVLEAYGAPEPSLE